MTEDAEKKITRKAVDERVRRIVEAVFACKWSLTILTLVQQDVRRPGAISRTVEGLAPKVMNDCLSKLVGFGILEKRSYAEVPPRVTYHITPFGRRFMGLFTLIDDLAADFAPADP